MIKLKQVSKFYYTKGVVASGFTKVSLDFNMGEFVAITGESGSGKSTLLNVISGLDTYEEGEMYINGKETSHYTEKDFEEYRNKYIGNIFQSFNLINSYTVFQNVELVLILAGMSKKEAKIRANELIDKVGLSEYRRTKASKLSGGQKQRVAIARALAKDTPIIIADEPTGNLDSESAKEVFRILSEVSKEKLVIIVTHNYEQVEPYVTRKITMHDGKVVEDYKIDKEEKEDSYVEPNEIKKINFFNKLRLGFRNAFNIPAKFLLLLLVFTFVSSSLISQYASMREATFEQGVSGWNWYFRNASEKRIVLKNVKDGVPVPFSEEDFESISALSNIETLETQDLLVDQEIDFFYESNDRYIYLYGIVSSINNLDSSIKVQYGRMPEAPNEMLLVVPKENYYLTEAEAESYLDLPFNRYSQGGRAGNYIISGITFVDNEMDSSYINGDIEFYVSDGVLSDILLDSNISYSTLTYEFMGETYEDNGGMWHIVISDVVEPGTCVMSEDHNYLVEKTYKAKGQTLKVNVKNPYFSDSMDLVCANTYSLKEMKKYYTILEGEEYQWYYGFIFVNADDYKSLYNKPSYQASVFVKDAHMLDETLAELKELGFTTLAIRDTLYSDESSAILQLISNFMTIFAAFILLIISYFVIRIILKSRNVYYSTIRMLGANVKVSRSLLIIELVIDATISYIITLGLIIFLPKFGVSFDLLNSIVQYMNVKSYIIVYLIVFVISLIISLRYASKLFRKSNISTLKEEV